MAGSSSTDLPCSASIEVVGSVRPLVARTHYFAAVTVE
jgi:hypothetical protein